MNLQLNKFYWVRFYRDNAKWEPCERVATDHGDGWHRLAIDLEYYDTEVNQVGPEIIPPEPPEASNDLA